MRTHRRIVAFFLASILLLLKNKIGFRDFMSGLDIAQNVHGCSTVLLEGAVDALLIIFSTLKKKFLAMLELKE